MDCVRRFSCYGPLKEIETELRKNSNIVKVVFKKCVDAERAFRVVGKYGSFGPSLSSFQLVNLPFSLGMSELNYPELCLEDSGPKVPAPRESGVPLGAVQIGIVSKADKAEAVRKISVEQVEMVKQAGQAKDTIKRALHDECTNEESPKVLVDTMQILSCLWKYYYVEASKDTMEVDNVDEAREEARVPQEFQDQALTEELRQQVVGETLENEAATEALLEVTAEGDIAVEAPDEEATKVDKIVGDGTVEASD